MSEGSGIVFLVFAGELTRGLLSSGGIALAVVSAFIMAWIPGENVLFSSCKSASGAVSPLLL